MSEYLHMGAPDDRPTPSRAVLVDELARLRAENERQKEELANLRAEIERLKSMLDRISELMAAADATLAAIDSALGQCEGGVMSEWKLRLIRTEAENEVALMRIAKLMENDPPPDTDEGAELSALATLVEHFERRYVFDRATQPSPPQETTGGCFWATGCSNRARCSTAGLCVAGAQNALVTIPRLRAAIERKDRALEKATDELRNIAEAKPHTWDEEVRGDFQAWAQSRARFTLAAIDSALGNVSYCICADPENCTEAVPGYICRRGNVREG